ncbi:MAG: ParA family protein [Synechococcales cyanobacterium RU_4_20]|nr:ParA family protein [Synechococcales cyanobacterium RU_4_20]NJR67530.1 ParA family protein [Synechococcales cyanobacterium CRU_2_2]
MAHVIATTNMKGGVGKTTLCVNLAASLARNFGKRVLVVDLDTQISGTLSLMSPQEFVKCRKERRTLRQLISQTVDSSAEQIHDTAGAIRPYICEQKGLSLLPGDLDLYDDYMVSSFLHEQANADDADHDFQTAWEKLERTLVKGILEPVQNDYDFIILDCAPGYNLLTRSSFVASDFYLLPAKPEPLSIAGIQLLQRRIERLRQGYEDSEPIKIELLGIVFTMSGNLFTSRYYNQVMKRVQQDYSEQQIFKTQIPNDAQVSRAVDSFKPVILSNPTATGAKAFAKLTEEFLQKLEILTGTKEQKSRMSLSQME